MPKRVLILGVDARAADAARKARAIGLTAVVMDRESESPAIAAADEFRVADYLDAAEIVRVARATGVDGILPPTEPAVLPAAHAANALGFSGWSVGVTTLMRDKLAMRDALAAAGLRNPPYRAAWTDAETESAVRDIGLPVIVRPADSLRGAGISQVDHVEDACLAFIQAARHSESKTVIVERVVRGQELTVEGFMRNGAFRSAAILGRERSLPPCCYDLEVVTPPELYGGEREDVLDFAHEALCALEMRDGWAHLDMVVTSEGPYVVEIAGFAAALRLPADPTALACGNDTLALALRYAVGDMAALEADLKDPLPPRGGAIAWIPSRSGVVQKVVGVAEARALPGVESVVIATTTGDVMGHIVDNETRDRVGYVTATGDTGPAALENARRARDLCLIVTTPEL